MLSASALPMTGSACCNARMLTGTKLGDALGDAIKKKGLTQQQVADEFGIRQSSVSEWVRFGRIGKQHIPHLVAFFGDQVGPEHWGLPPGWKAGWPLPYVDQERYERLKPDDQLYAQAKMMAAIEERESGVALPAVSSAARKVAATIDAYPEEDRQILAAIAKRAIDTYLKARKAEERATASSRTPERSTAGQTRGR